MLFWNSFAFSMIQQMDGAGVGSRGEAPEAQNFKAAQWKGPLSSLLTQYVAMGEQYRSHLGAYQKC